MSESDAYLAFANLNGVGPKTFKRLLAKFDSAVGIWEADAEDLRIPDIGPLTIQKIEVFRNEFDLASYRSRLEKLNVHFISQIDEKYPEGLFQLDDAPLGIFIKGDISCLNTKPSIGIVGTRKITSYGRAVTEKLASELSLSNFTIISGMALGVDAAAHKATLENKGRTIAVLGCGVDCPNPTENTNLYTKIIEAGGLILSEYPLGEPPSKGSFPARNRIIAALSDGVLITEATDDSGSLITADWAARLGRKVFSVPGPITSTTSHGTSKLLKNGAKFVTSTQDILDEFQLEVKTLKLEKIDIESLDLSKNEMEVLRLILNEPLEKDKIAKKLGIPIAEFGMLVSGLELQGYLKDSGGKLELVI